MQHDSDIQAQQFILTVKSDFQQLKICSQSPSNDSPVPFLDNTSFIKETRKPPGQDRQPSWISIRLGRLGKKKPILVSSYALQARRKTVPLDFEQDSSKQGTFSTVFFSSFKLK